MALNILVTAWNRPANLSKILQLLDSFQQNSKIFIAVDGESGIDPYLDSKVFLTKKIAIEYKFINPETQISINPNNLGCKRGMQKALSWFFSQVDRGIILEDDIKIKKHTLEYFEYCLEKFENDKKIYMINGYNPINEKYLPEKPYLSKFPHIWGWATWADRWSNYQGNFSPTLDNLLDLSNLETLKQHPFQIKQFDKYFLNQFRETYSGLIDTWDYQWVWTIWKNGGYALSAPVNLVENIGFGFDATHTKAGESSPISLEGEKVVKNFILTGKILNLEIMDCIEEIQKYKEFGMDNDGFKMDLKVNNDILNSKIDVTKLAKIYRSIIPFKLRAKINPAVKMLRANNLVK
jgi:hypothetical protein